MLYAKGILVSMANLGEKNISFLFFALGKKVEQETGEKSERDFASEAFTLGYHFQSPRRLKRVARLR